MDQKLIITADDFGRWPSYDAGMLEAIEAGAVDAVSVMALRLEAVPAQLTEWDGALGLHLERVGGGSLLREGVGEQIEQFERLVGRRPDYLDGHHHCHASADVVEVVAGYAAGMGLPVRSVGDEHRELLRGAGVRTPDLLIGRYEEAEAVRPAELDSLPGGWTEWMVHPGRPDPRSGSSYDTGRGEDLEALLTLELPMGIARCDHRDLPS